MQRGTSISDKILTHEQLVRVREEIVSAGKTLVQCHGCFDIVHPGHVRHLQFAAAQGDRLIVSITADAFVKKGPDRPMFTHALRAENLAALVFVDWVYIHHEPTAVELLRDIQPDVYIKGAEYATADDQRFIDEREVVEANNGRVVFSSGDVVFSSTSIVESIQKVSRLDPEVAQLAELAKTHDFSTGSIACALDNAKGKRVVVVGETILDTYTHCQWPEIADEHPMLSLKPVWSEHFDGGAAIVAQHLAALGTQPILFTPIPLDFDARPFIQRMNDRGVDVMPIEVEGEMPEKKRFVVGRDKVMKLDCTSCFVLDAHQQQRVIEKVRLLAGLDCLVLTDFGLGLLGNGLAENLCQTVRDRVGLVIGDVSGARTSLSSMLNADVLCPSETELRLAMNDHDKPIVDLARRLLAKTGAGVIVVTLGVDGLVIISANNEVRLPALSHDPIDVLGCGDALLAGVCASMLGGAGLVESAYIGSLAASIAGSVMGNVAVGRAQVLNRSQSLGAQYAHSRAEIEAKQLVSKASEPIL